MNIEEQVWLAMYLLADLQSNLLAFETIKHSEQYQIKESRAKVFPILVEVGWAFDILCIFSYHVYFTPLALDCI